MLAKKKEEGGSLLAGSLQKLRQVLLGGGGGALGRGVRAGIWASFGRQDWQKHGPGHLMQLRSHST